MANTVTLTWSEMRLAADVGVDRRLVSMKNDLLGKHGYAPIKPFDDDILGAMGELAVAKYFGMYWSMGINTFKLPDVGTLQVRTTLLPNGQLILRDGDSDGIYVLVIADKQPVFTLAGYGIAKDIRQRDKVVLGQGRPPCWAVKQAQLAPVELLKISLK